MPIIVCTAANTYAGSDVLQKDNEVTLILVYFKHKMTMKVASKVLLSLISCPYSRLFQTQNDNEVSKQSVARPYFSSISEKEENFGNTISVQKDNGHSEKGLARPSLCFARLVDLGNTIFDGSFP